MPAYIIATRVGVVALTCVPLGAGKGGKGGKGGVVYQKSVTNQAGAFNYAETTQEASANGGAGGTGVNGRKLLVMTAGPVHTCCPCALHHAHRQPLCVRTHPATTQQRHDHLDNDVAPILAT